MSGGLNLYLIRHPKPDIAPGVCYGRSDIGVLANAASCAQRLNALLPPPDRVFSSPLKRCAELANELASHLPTPPEFDPRLQEIDFGAWEGQAWGDIPRQHIDAWACHPFDFAPPGGESARRMADRVIEFLSGLAAPASARNLVVVSHQGPLRVIIAHCLGGDANDWLAHHFEYAALTTLSSRTGKPGQFTLAGHNQ